MPRIFLPAPATSPVTVAPWAITTLPLARKSCVTLKVSGVPGSAPAGTSPTSVMASGSPPITLTGCVTVTGLDATATGGAATVGGGATVTGAAAGGGRVTGAGVMTGAGVITGCDDVFLFEAEVVRSDDGAAFGLSMTSMTRSGTPSFVSRIISAVERSNFVSEARIRPMTSDGESFSLTIAITS